jgi:hypothetical protein
MNFHRQKLKQLLALLAVPFLCLASFGALAQASIYRCIGNPVMYTSDQRLAIAKNCALVGGGEPTVRVEAVRRKSADGETPPQSGQVNSSVAKVSSVERATRFASPEQKARDSDRLTILMTELRDEKVKYETLKQKLTAAGSSGTGNEASVTELNKAIVRSQSDMAALEREIARAH